VHKRLVRQLDTMIWTPPEWCVAANSSHEEVLLEVCNQEKEHQYPISEKAWYTLGRESDQDIGLTGECTSRKHAVILRGGDGRWFIQDLRSTGGTFMQSHRLEPLTPYELTPGIDVVLGPEPKHDLIRLVTTSSMQTKRCEDTLQRVPTRNRDCLEAAEEQQSCRSHQQGIVAVLTQARARSLEEPLPAAKRRQTLELRRSPDVPSAPAKKCDKCDGPHLTDACPHFKKPREEHKDAWVNYGRKNPLTMGNSGGNFILRCGRPVRQPGDGDCLFHSLSFGLNDNRNAGWNRARELRRELARFVERNPKVEISGDTLEQWVLWDANTSVSNYARRMAVSGWGGGIEMAVCSLLKKVNVHVYESKASGFKRISCFDCPEPAKRTIHVLYQGGVHFDALLPR